MYINDTHHYNPFSQIGKFRSRLSQKFKFMFLVLVGDFLNTRREETNYGIFDWLTFFSPYGCLHAMINLAYAEKIPPILGLAIGLLIFAPLTICLLAARLLFAAVGMVLASPFVLLSHAVSSVCLLFKSYRNKVLLKMCAQADEKMDVEFVQKLLARGVNIHACDAQGRTYLDLLCLEPYGRNSSVCDLLLNKGGKFTQQDSLNNCLKSLAWKYPNNALDLQAKQLKRLLEFGADPKIIQTDFEMNLIRDVIATESNHDLGILIILNIPFNEIEDLGKHDGNCIEKLIHHIAQSGENQDTVLQTLKAQFDNKNIKKIEEMQIKDFCAKFSPKFSKEEGAGIFELLKCGRKMQGDGYKRDNSEAPYLPKLPIGIFGMIAQRMVPKESPALLFEVDSQEICHKML